MAEVLNVRKRETQGKRRNRRLRAAGEIPAVLYGHGEENLVLAVSGEEFMLALRRGARIVDLKGDVDQRAMIRECQWDTWGQDVMHVDFTRISLHEKITVVVPLELRGEAPGQKEGGSVKHALHQLEIECQADNIIDKVSVSINTLLLDEAITVGDLNMPEGVVPTADPSTVVVSCSIVVELDEEETGEGIEPELIGRKAEDDESED
jgi:large subunit ribosomal protein L25